MRVDVRHHIDGVERFEIQHDFGPTQLPDSAKLGKCKRWVLRNVVSVMKPKARSSLAAHRAFVYHDAMKASIKRAFAWICVAMLTWTACVSAADERASGGRVPTVTRL